MTQLTEEQQNAVRKKREREQRRETLEAAMDKIIQGMERNSVRSGERAIWELVQNARDLAKNGNAIINIRLSQDGLYFSHQGEPFTIQTLQNLIKQQSTKRNDKEAVGQYGTGFMTTHVFNRKVYISGDCQIDYDGKSMYVPLPNDFCLNRDFTDGEGDAFIDEMGKELDAVMNLIACQGEDTPNVWTTFHYELTGEKTLKVSEQLRRVELLMPIVMVLNDKIKECTIQNDLSGTRVTFTHGDRYKDCINFDGKNSFHAATIIKVAAEGETSEVVLNSIESEGRENVVIVPPMPPFYTNMDDVPSEFLFFPLLGSENFGTNFIFHSRKMYPVETRDSYLWPVDNDSVIEKYKNNIKVLDEIIDMLFAYYDGDENRQNIPVTFAKLSFPTNGQDAKTNEFYESLQTRFASKFATWKMIPSPSGYQKISQNANFGVLNDDVYDGLTNEQRAQYISVVAAYAAKVKSVPSADNILPWSEAVRSWSQDHKEWFVGLGDICAKINGQDSQLHSFLMLLHEQGSTGEKFFEQYALIPNRKGVLRQKSQLRDAKDIVGRLYQLAEPIIKSRADVMVDTSYADITTLTPYTRKDLQKDLSSAIDQMRRDTLNLTPKREIESKTAKDLMAFCSAYPTEDPKNYRSKLMPTICKLYGEMYKPEFLEPVETASEEENMYTSPFNFLVEQAMLSVSSKDATWLDKEKGKDANAHHTNLLDFITIYVGDGKNTERMSKLSTYGIFPNQMGKVCLAKDLKKNVDIEDDLIDLYKDAFGKNLKEQLVDNDFASLYNFTELTAKGIGREVDEKVIEEKPSDILLTILTKIDEEGNNWKTYFPRIAAEQESLYYTLSTSEEKKAMFAIQKKGVEVLKRMAKIAGSDNLDSILSQAENMVAQQEERDRQFRFTYAIGVAIENAIKDQINKDLQCICINDEDHLNADDIQNGQDIIISYKGRNLYYLECKAKWNFNEAAHMSSQQMKQAVREQGHYALICIDCTAGTGCHVAPDASQEDVQCQIQDILNHTYVHKDIGQLLSDTVKPIVEREEVDESLPDEDTLKIYGSLTCNIPKRKFIGGIRYKDFIESLTSYLKEQMEEMR